MFDGYELLDFHRGRKLERCGQFVLDRPSESAVARHRPAGPELWLAAVARYDRLGRGQGNWIPAGALPAAWEISFADLRFELRPTPSGQIGLFPEHASIWRQLIERCRRLDRPAQVLNLFAYTGGATLSAAAAGAEVTHVDSAANIVRWARRNAELSGLADRPIHWIVDDVPRFVARELRRGRRYDVIVLDPPTYGHGPRGQSWKFDDNLPVLLRALRPILDEMRGAVILTCHTVGYDGARLRAMLADAFGRESTDAGALGIATAGVSTLSAGHWAAWRC